MPYERRTFQVHHHSGEKVTCTLDAEVFGSGNIMFRYTYRNEGDAEYELRTAAILIDAEDLERLEPAVREAKRRNRASARRARRRAKAQVAKMLDRSADVTS